MGEKTIECPLCNGDGRVITKVHGTGNPFADHPNRTLPLDYFCSECKNYVTISHEVNYTHGKFMYKVKKKRGRD